MILLKNLNSRNMTHRLIYNHIITAENITILNEDLKIISNINNSLIFDSDPSRIIIRFCLKLQIVRYYFDI